jgi:hypothetical protein
MAKPETHNVDLDQSEHARTKAAARKKGDLTRDPKTGERTSVSIRQLFNETEDMDKAKEIHAEIARAGGYGQTQHDLDLRSLDQSREANKKLADQAEDKFDRHRLLQQAQGQDGLVNEVREIFRKHGLKD